MQFLIISDIHANWYALEAVLRDAEGKYDQVVCCGDLVGYNPHPDRVTQWVRANCQTVIRGNHDKVVAGIDDLEWFNEVAKAAARWTMNRIGSTDRVFLSQLPVGPVESNGFQIWHGSVADEDEYVASVRDAAPHFQVFESPLAFFGHTHLQGGFFSKQGRVGNLPKVPFEDNEQTIELAADYFYMVNPGSVGQPRDGDPRAAYAIYDASRGLVTLRRIEYPIQKTVAAIKAAGLPEVLGIRLFHGV